MMLYISKVIAGHWYCITLLTCRDQSTSVPSFHLSVTYSEDYPEAPASRLPVHRTSLLSASFGCTQLSAFVVPIQLSHHAAKRKLKGKVTE